jgi:hypothetical protein
MVSGHNKIKKEYLDSVVEEFKSLSLKEGMQFSSNSLDKHLLAEGAEKEIRNYGLGFLLDSTSISALNRLRGDCRPIGLYIKDMNNPSYYDVIVTSWTSTIETYGKRSICYNCNFLNDCKELFSETKNMLKEYSL